jgi:hypothetical protein
VEVTDQGPETGMKRFSISLDRFCDDAVGELPEAHQPSTAPRIISALTLSVSSTLARRSSSGQSNADLAGTTEKGTRTFSDYMRRPNRRLGGDGDARSAAVCSAGAGFDQ